MSTTSAPDAAPAAVPEHTHLGAYAAIAGCPECARYGAINPDTLTPWPPLGEHGEQVIAETQDRFHDRYDGDNHATALEVALREAYLRGRMQGRTEERRDAAASARGALINALSHTRSALAALEADDERTAHAHASLAASAVTSAVIYRHIAGSER